jgi:hypothetical protein
MPERLKVLKASAGVFTIGSQRGVEHHRHSCSPAKLLNELVIAGIGGLADRLESASAVDVRRRWNHVSLVVFYICDAQHKSRGMVTLRLGQDEIGGSVLFLPRPMARMDGRAHGT